MEATLIKRIEKLESKLSKLEKKQSKTKDIVLQMDSRLDELSATVKEKGRILYNTCMNVRNLMNRTGTVGKSHVKNSSLDKYM
jgi:predicted nuclease with TOPRIM domain